MWKGSIGMNNPALESFISSMNGKTVAVCGIGKNNTPVVRQFLGYGAKVRACDKRSREALERVSLADRRHHKPTELSGGQQQRVAIARALAGNPSLILADEPTGNLDSKTGADVMNLFHELHKAGNTIVLITHDAKIAAQTPRAIHIHDGKVIEPVSESEVVI